MNCALRITAAPEHALLARVAQVLAWQRCRVEFLALRAPPDAREAVIEVILADTAAAPEQVRRQLLKLIDVRAVTLTIPAPAAEAELAGAWLESCPPA
jgi:acetolactate synthase regulatory subunit